MGSAWASFAASGNPNNGLIPTWLQFSGGNENYMTFASPQTHLITQLQTELCNAFDRVGYHPETRKYRLTEVEDRLRDWSGPNTSGIPRTMKDFLAYLAEQRSS
jgi:hypothetical protein